MIGARNLGVNIFSEGLGAFNGWSSVSEKDRANYPNTYTFNARTYDVLEVREHYESFCSFVRLRNLALAILVTLVSVGIALSHPVVRQWFTGRQVVVVLQERSEPPSDPQPFATDPDLQISQGIDWESFQDTHRLMSFSGIIFECDILLFSSESDGVRPYYLIHAHERLADLSLVLKQGCSDFEILNIDNEMINAYGIAPKYQNGIAVFVQEHDQNDADHTTVIDGQPVSPGLNMGKAFRWLAEILPQQLGYQVVWEQGVKERFKNSLMECGRFFSSDSHRSSMGFLRLEEFKGVFPALKGSYHVLDNLPS